MAHVDPVERRAYLKKRDADNRARVRAFIWQWKETHPCVGCGEDDPIVLEFDHRDPKQKKFQICDAADGSGKNMEVLLAEIAKCDVRCANCHRRKTFYDRAKGLFDL